MGRENLLCFSEQCSGLLELIIPTHLTQPYIRLCISWAKWVEKIYYAFPEECSGLLELIIPTRLTQQYIRLCQLVSESLSVIQ